MRHIMPQMLRYQHARAEHEAWHDFGITQHDVKINGIKKEQNLKLNMSIFLSNNVLPIIKSYFIFTVSAYIVTC